MPHYRTYEICIVIHIGGVPFLCGDLDLQRSHPANSLMLKLWYMEPAQYPEIEHCTIDEYAVTWSKAEIPVCHMTWILFLLIVLLSI
jgi:hypothetical protein